MSVWESSWRYAETTAGVAAYLSGRTIDWAVLFPEHDREADAWAEKGAKGEINNGRMLREWCGLKQLGSVGSGMTVVVHSGAGLACWQRCSPRLSVGIRFIRNANLCPMVINKCLA